MYRNYYNYQNMNDRFVGTGFIFPFLVGSLAGGAAVGLSRPRPIYATQPYYGYNTPYGGYQSSYYGYVPYNRPF